jgi:glycosyltransferase involved in cell wall biosynthesis
LNILYLSQFFDVTGGSEYLFYTLAKSISERGHHVEVICHKVRNSGAVNPVGINIRQIRPEVVHTGQLPPSIAKNIGYICNAILSGSGIIRSNQIDLIHANSYSSILAASILSAIYRKPLVSTIHDVFSTSSPDSWKQWAQQSNASKVSLWIGPIFEKLTIRVPSSIIHAVSEATKRDILKIKNKSRIIVIPIGIDLRLFDDQITVTEYQNFILFIGRLVYYKNLDVIISCFSEIVKKIPEAKLMVVGDGPMRSKWETLSMQSGLENNIRFMGFVCHETKKMLLSKCSALVLPSTFEGFGLVILEAFAMKKPALVSDVEPFDEIVDNGRDGYLIPLKDKAEWVKRIVEVLLDRERSCSMGANGRRKVEDKFSLDRFVDRIEHLYESIRSDNTITRNVK